MTVEAFPAEAARLATASDWLARLQRDDLTEADTAAFADWLEASPANVRAYDDVLSIWSGFDDGAQSVMDEVAVLERHRNRAKGVGRRWLVGAGGLAAAAGLALAVLPQMALGPHAETYATAKGQRETVKLADGSTVNLNAESSLAVTLANGERRVDMGPGEAVFDVAADARRPFLIDAGGNSVRVVGTQFNVRNREDGFAVTVSRGLVEVRPRNSAKTYRLHPGQKLAFGADGAVRLSAVEANEALSWRTGRRIYRDVPLSSVVTDLNHQFPTQVRIDDPELAATPVSGVLVIDDQRQVIDRLSLMLHLTALPSDQGVLLRRK